MDVDRTGKNHYPANEKSKLSVLDGSSPIDISDRVPWGNVESRKIVKVEGRERKGSQIGGDSSRICVIISLEVEGEGKKRPPNGGGPKRRARCPGYSG